MLHKRILQTKWACCQLIPQILVQKLSYFSLLDDKNNRGFPLTSAGNKSYKVSKIEHEKLIWSNKPRRSEFKKTSLRTYIGLTGYRMKYCRLFDMTFKMTNNFKAIQSISAPNFMVVSAVTDIHTSCWVFPLLGDFLYFCSWTINTLDKLMVSIYPIDKWPVTNLYVKLKATEVNSILDSTGKTSIDNCFLTLAQ